MFHFSTFGYTLSINHTAQNNSFQNAQLSGEGPQVVTKEAHQLSAEGLQVVSERPRHTLAEGLQVAPDSSPEVVWNDGGDEKLGLVVNKKATSRNEYQM